VTAVELTPDRSEVFLIDADGDEVAFCNPQECEPFTTEKLIQKSGFLILAMRGYSLVSHPGVVAGSDRKATGLGHGRADRGRDYEGRKEEVLWWQRQRA